MRGFLAKRAAIVARTLGAASDSITSAATAATRSACSESPQPKSSTRAFGPGIKAAICSAMAR